VQDVGRGDLTQKQAHQAQVGQKDQPDGNGQRDQMRAFDDRERVARLCDGGSDRAGFDRLG
jgi:hypothetical protein